jgi:hypothetical protein
MAFFWPNMAAYKPQELFFQYSVFIFVGISFIVPIKREVQNKTLAILFFFMMAHTLLMHYEPQARMALVNTFLGVLAIKIIAERVCLNFKKIGILFLGFVFLNLFWIVLQMMNKDPIFTNLFYQNMPEIDHVGFMGARFALGCMAALVLPFIYYLHPAFCIFLIPLL